MTTRKKNVEEIAEAAPVEVVEEKKQRAVKLGRQCGKTEMARQIAEAEESKKPTRKRKVAVIGTDKLSDSIVGKQMKMVVDAAAEKEVVDAIADKSGSNVKEPPLAPIADFAFAELPPIKRTLKNRCNRSISPARRKKRRQIAYASRKANRKK